jgi:hypothetical protein
LDQLFWRTFFGEIPGGPGFERANRNLFFRMHRQNKNRKIWIFVLEFFQYVEPATPGQGNIQDDDIRLAVTGEFKCFRVTPRLPGYYHIRLFGYDLFEPAADDGVVVGNEHFNHDTPSAALGNSANVNDVDMR